MILKLKIEGAWRLIDHVDEVDVLPVKDGDYFDGAKVAVRYTKNGETLTQPVDDEAYLLNDDGKTIQVLLRTSVRAVPEY